MPIGKGGLILEPMEPECLVAWLTGFTKLTPVAMGAADGVPVGPVVQEDPPWGDPRGVEIDQPPAGKGLLGRRG